MGQTVLKAVLVRNECISAERRRITVASPLQRSRGVGAARGRYLPPRGYWQSELYAKAKIFGNICVGMKRYHVPKPDGRRAQANVGITVADVHTITKYCPRFKCNVKRDQLNMPVGHALQIVTEDCKTEGQKSRQHLERSGGRLSSLISEAGSFWVSNALQSLCNSLNALEHTQQVKTL